MARRLKVDKVLFATTLLLICVSVVMVYSASAVVAFERFDQSDLFLTKQVLWAVLGLAVLSIAMRVDYRTYRNEAFIWAVLGFVGLLLVAVLFSAPVNGTRRWFGLGGLGIQPSELAKLACVLFAALILERRMQRIDDLSYSLLPIGIVVGGMVGLIMLQPDYGTAMTLVLIVGAMVYAAGLHYRYVVGTALVLVPVLYILLVSAPYRRERLLAFWDPWADPLDSGFQIIQSLIAVGSGGVTGRGFMEGVQKLFYLPEPHTDFIYAVIGEELGLVGATAVLLCFCVIAWRGPPHRPARRGLVRQLRRARPDDHDRRAGVREHERGAQPAPDHGHPAAVCQRWRVVAPRQPARDGRVAEHLAARGEGCLSECDVPRTSEARSAKGGREG